MLRLQIDDESRIAQRLAAQRTHRPHNRIRQCVSQRIDDPHLRSYLKQMRNLHRIGKQGDLTIAANQSLNRLLQWPRVVRERPTIHRDLQNVRPTLLELLKQFAVRHSILLDGDRQSSHVWTTITCVHGLQQLAPGIRFWNSYADWDTETSQRRYRLWPPGNNRDLTQAFNQLRSRIPRLKHLKECTSSHSRQENHHRNLATKQAFRKFESAHVLPQRDLGH